MGEHLSFVAYVTAEQSPTVRVYRPPDALAGFALASVMDATTASTSEEVRREFVAQLRKWADRLDGGEQGDVADLSRLPD